MRAEQVSLKEKEYLNPQEAIKHWNLSNRKFYNFLKEGPYNFIAYYGTRKLIIRTVFDKYLNENPRCGDIIESKSVHDFVTCSCGSCSVDGGYDYLRRCGFPEDWESCSETYEDGDDTKKYIEK